MALIKVSKLLAKKFGMQNQFFKSKSVKLAEALAEIDAEHPGFEICVLDSVNKVNNFIAISVNGEMINRNIENVSLCEDDKVVVINMIAGG